MFKKLTIAMMFVAISAFGSKAFALSITDPGVVGAYKGSIEGGTNLDNERALANYLLLMLAGTSDLDGPGGVAAGPGVCGVSAPTAVQGCYQTSNTEYAAILTGGVKSDNPDDFAVNPGNMVPAGYQFVMGKWDGPNGGYVLFSINGAFALPQSSDPIWVGTLDEKGKGNTDGYGLSHWTAWKSGTIDEQCTNGTCETVPDGGMTLLLLGVAMLGLAVLRRRLA